MKSFVSIVSFFQLTISLLQKQQPVKIQHQQQLEQQSLNVPKQPGNKNIPEVRNKAEVEGDFVYMHSQDDDRTVLKHSPVQQIAIIPGSKLSCQLVHKQIRILNYLGLYY